MKKPLVGILMGSESDLPIMEKAAEVLKEMGIPYEIGNQLSPSIARKDSPLCQDSEEARD